MTLTGFGKRATCQRPPIDGSDSVKKCSKKTSIFSIKPVSPIHRADSFFWKD
jgi:hypothetical protein